MMNTMNTMNATKLILNEQNTKKIKLILGLDSSLSYEDAKKILIKEIAKEQKEMKCGHIPQT